MKSPAAIASLKYRDFRLIWFGQFVSILGTQIQTVALAWLVYSLTGSAAALGVVGLARAIPTILLSMFGGTLADQVDRRRLLLVSQSVLASFSALLAVFVSLGMVNLAMLVWVRSHYRGGRGIRLTYSSGHHPFTCASGTTSECADRERAGLRHGGCAWPGGWRRRARLSGYIGGVLDRCSVIHGGRGRVDRDA